MNGRIAERGGMAVLVLLSVAGLWVVAASIEFSVPRWERVIASMGSVMPLPTAYVIDGVRLHLPSYVAALGTLLIGVLWLRRSRLCANACAVALFVGAVGASIVAWAQALPFYECGLGAGERTTPGSCGAIPGVRRLGNAHDVPGLAGDWVAGIVGWRVFLHTLPDGAHG